MAECAPLLVWKLSRRARELVAWDVDGLPEDAVASIHLENSGTWHPLMINSERDVLSIWIAGPNFGDPGSAVVVTVTSWAEIRVVTGQTTVFIDAGYIELVP